MPMTPEPHLTSGQLTPREERVLELVGAGRLNREIAALLHVTTKDVEYHVGNLLRKLGCRNRTEAVSRAYTLGLLSVASWPPAMATPPAEAARAALPPPPIWDDVGQT